MPRQTITLGHSPDPDDAFMFYALTRGKIDTGAYAFEERLEDIESLNRRAERGELDITAVSFHAYPFIAGRYALLSCGASMGEGYGPIVVSRRPLAAAELGTSTIAVPGERTSAFLALRLAIGEFRHTLVPFDRIIDAVRSGSADAGLLIHEGQLTYAGCGLSLVLDLGTWWATTTGGLPLPLGANAVRRDLGVAVIRELAGLLRRSIDWGLDHRAEALAHAERYGRDLSRDLADRFVGMYVNERTRELGSEGREAVRLLLARGAEAGLVPEVRELTFVAP